MSCKYIPMMTCLHICAACHRKGPVSSKECTCTPTIQRPLDHPLLNLFLPLPIPWHARSAINVTSITRGSVIFQYTVMTFPVFATSVVNALTADAYKVMNNTDTGVEFFSVSRQLHSRIRSAGNWSYYVSRIQHLSVSTTFNEICFFSG